MDFYAAYNLIAGRHQRCWVHLLRDLHKLKEEQAEKPEVVEWATAVRQLLRGGADVAAGAAHTHSQGTATPVSRSHHPTLRFGRTIRDGG